MSLFLLLRPFPHRGGLTIQHIFISLFISCRLFSYPPPAIPYHLKFLLTNREEKN